MSIYLARIIPFDEPIATHVLDACRAERQSRSSTPDRWTYAPSPAASLRLGPGSERFALRSFSGVAIARHRRARVELELSRWSRDACELGIRFPHGCAPSLHESVGATLDALADELELRALLLVQPDHRTAASALL